MPDKQTKRFHVWTPILFTLVLIVGLILGYQANKYLGKKRDISTVMDRDDRLEEMISIVNQKYVDPINSDSLYSDAVNGIISQLDPHTTYVPAKEYAQYNDALDGNYKGIGVDIEKIQDTAYIVYVEQNSPAAKNGISPGDQIISLNNKTVAGNNTPSDSINSFIRGEANTPITLELKRPSSGELHGYSIIRTDVNIPSVEAHYMMKDGTGYIRISRFSNNTDKEFAKSLSDLKSQGLQKLILDLRQNGGGYLEAAIGVLDQFINNDKLLVYTKGEKIGTTEYKASKNGLFEAGRIVVMVDEATASASEIVAGAIQDWDRGVIIGRKTFGKGLVQEQFEFSDGSALRLTIARYYTPVGRSIQRPYDKGRSAYASDYQKRLLEEAKGIEVDDTIKEKRFFTKELHRVVYGGGGIRPDIIIPFSIDAYTNNLYYLLNYPDVLNYTYKYYAYNLKTFQQYKSLDEFIQNFNPSGEIMNNMASTLAKNYPDYVKGVWSSKTDLAFLTNYFKASLARMQFYWNGYYEISNNNDMMVDKAFQIINSDKYSEIITGNRS